MQLLVATDHRFYRNGDTVYDTYCFDRSFFDDYRSAFDSVVVMARVKTSAPPSTAQVASGSGVYFVDMPDVQGARWALGAGWVCSQSVPEAVKAADAVCVRIPSQLGVLAAKWALRFGKPLMFELIGDPAAALEANGPLAKAWGALSARRTATITANSEVGSYVSRSHLQQRYPASPKAVTDSISSIRLPGSQLVEPKVYHERPIPLRVILVASLVPVKQHALLLRAVHHAQAQGCDVELTCVGDGPLRPSLEVLAQELGIREQVVFCGHVAERATLIGHLDSADLFAMTSISEGMPRAMIEAMARGLPAVGTAVGGIQELLEADQLVPPDGAGQLGDLFCELARDPERLSALARRSAEQAAQFEIEVLSEKRRGLIQHLYNLATVQTHESALATA